MTMRELWDKAREYGRVYLYTSKDGTYSCTIEFASIQNTSLEAKSGYNCATPEDAINRAAINAQKIVDQFSPPKQMVMIDGR